MRRPGEPENLPPCLRLSGLLPLTTPLDGDRLPAYRDLATAVHNMYVAVLRARKVKDSLSPLLFDGPRRAPPRHPSPFRDLVGPLPLTEAGAQGLVLGAPTTTTWPWEPSFLDSLREWLTALRWPAAAATGPGDGTVTYLELALDYESHAGRALPAAPQARLRGTHLPLQERARVLRLAMAKMQALATSGRLHPAQGTARSPVIIPIGGPALVGLTRRPFFACRHAMVGHLARLATYCESWWARRPAKPRAVAPRPYTYRATPPFSGAERLARAMAMDLSAGLLPSSEAGVAAMAKGGGSSSTHSFGADFIPAHGGRHDAPFRLLRRRDLPSGAAPPPPPCAAHGSPACVNCLRLRRNPEDCCASGHHEGGHVPRRPMSRRCEHHDQPACAECTRAHRGVRHCCSRHHPPVLAALAAPQRKRARRPQSQGAQRPRPQPPAPDRPAPLSQPTTAGRARNADC